MKEYVKVLNKYLSENPPELTKCHMERILDMLCCCYFQRWGNDSNRVRGRFEELDNVLEKLNITEQDAVVDITCELCSLHRQEAFREGVLVGFRLFAELSQP